ncbi:hypothetical protein [Pedobacter hartonius]|uniref:DUF4369 domain-containing protein n=1 Tax=Pedobacter hartonius TaxID=425514 RepID=A0A1H4B194_9SPHI|nr:hypothetical protein [Pedobacter hartonius]SEA41935.1 hypothetical protein SAMN05443550_103172 [Pedobacter hartonius]
MKTIKYLSTFLLLSILTLTAAAQDAVVISDGDFIRGTIQGTDFLTVGIKKDNGEVQQFNAKDIKEFLWNGETFVSKPFVNHKKTEYRFFKMLESGSVNLYSMGGNTGPEKKRRRMRFMPSIGLGIGTGGFGGFGFGGGVSIDGRSSRDDEEQRPQRQGLYYIEKPGTGDMLEITPDQNNPDANYRYIRNTLLDKFSDDQDLTARVKEMNSFDVKSIQSLVKAYNSVHQNNSNQPNNN